jgi:hypothetical protein
MLLKTRWSGVLGLSKGSLRTKIIAWSFVPTAIILLAVALVTFYAYQQVTEELAIERDQELIRLSAGQLATEMGEYEDLLLTLARTPDIYRSDPATQRNALKRASNRLAILTAACCFSTPLERSWPSNQSAKFWDKTGPIAPTIRRSCTRK